MTATDVIGTGQSLIRVGVMEEAIQLTTKDRNEIYGNFVDDMDCLGALEDIYYPCRTRYCRGHNASMGQALVKIARIINGRFHRDNYVDAVNYISEAYESEIYAQNKLLLRERRII